MCLSKVLGFLTSTQPTKSVNQAGKNKFDKKMTLKILCQIAIVINCIINSVNLGLKIYQYSHQPNSLTNTHSFK
ncbi:hypothetical protein PCC7424_0623 [Gloeothece citriformis PCC 7424]|uniref:Uncharacterized protein n=1 Tax=Gloeothece citriformis (strain PCC 7424) TaxID=65393 RepID=B7KEQ8_GLOC7|nr:hypothetical protein PCC7424_0623 [Gloeothece citriformis PCC 7424]